MSGKSLEEVAQLDYSLSFSCQDSPQSQAIERYFLEFRALEEKHERFLGATDYFNANGDLGEAHGLHDGRNHF